MATKIDLRGVSDENKCEDAREVASKVGIQIVCNDEESDDNAGAIHVPNYDGCTETKEVASKFGVQVVCDDET